MLKNKTSDPESLKTISKALQYVQRLSNSQKTFEKVGAKRQKGPRIVLGVIYHMLYPIGYLSERYCKFMNNYRYTFVLREKEETICLLNRAGVLVSTEDAKGIKQIGGTL